MNNLKKKTKLSMQHIIENSRYVYYGYIKPSDDHLKKFEKILNLKDIKLKLFFI